MRGFGSELRITLKDLEQNYGVFCTFAFIL